MIPNTIIQGDCLDVLKTLQDNSIDACVTDPPYGLSFMGKKWDYDVPKKEIWEEVLRVLKPGGYLLSFAGTRTQHRMAVNIEDAGFEIRDMIAWVYGSGFPKSLNIGKAVDKLQGNERKITATTPDRWTGKGNTYQYSNQEERNIDVNITKGSSEWEGWGTALKPALEPITVARKPLSENTVALNVLKWGTGGINIDGSRVGIDERTYKGMSAHKPDVGTFRDDNWQPKDIEVTVNGRFPANLIHDGSEEVTGLFPNTKGELHNKLSTGNSMFMGEGVVDSKRGFSIYDSGSASRFFYCAKSSKEERNKGCEKIPLPEENLQGLDTRGRTLEREDGSKTLVERWKGAPRQNNHPTVKPVSLMEYLVKLVSREGATILDPFMGSGSTGIACKKLGREFIGIEIDENYVKIAKARIAAWEREPEQFNLF